MGLKLINSAMIAKPPVEWTIKTCGLDFIRATCFFIQIGGTY